MKPGRVVALVAGVVLVVPFFLLFVAGGIVLAVYGTQRDEAGFFTADLDRVASATAAIVSEEVDLRDDGGPTEWLLDTVEATVRLRAVGLDEDRPIFIGIGPATDVAAYLNGVGRDEVREVDGDRLRFRSVDGAATAAPPGGEAFWVVSAEGNGEQEVVWEVESGEWTAVLMNADGSGGIVADLEVGAKAGILLGLAIGMVAVGALLTALAVALIVFAVRGRPVVPAVEPEGAVEPVRLEADLDPELSPWKWLVKWFLAIPHVVVLAFLWIAFVVLTILAWFAILFTGRYPRSMFDFNVGVLRWSWRVTYYAFSGGLGTDRYPPFTLAADPDYPAHLDVTYPERLSRGLVLVKSWLLAIPHIVVVAILVGTTWGDSVTAPGLIPVLVLIAAVILLFTGRYPRALFDLIVGLNRWVVRVGAYVALMTDRYPPFRLDQGGGEPENGSG